jgi:23S rRNA (adenine2030-N6)-methyltransferase
LLSYEHAFHAGNHADVLKHASVCALLRALSSKPKPFFYLDTHAGSGCYEIEGHSHHDDVAARLLTAQDGAAISNLLPTAIADYVQIIKPYLSKASYPGSPLIVSDMLELLGQEKAPLCDIFLSNNLQLSELHPSAFALLKQWMSPTPFHCHHRDGLELLNALTPPKPKRGLVLIDPAYEQASEYAQLVDSVSKALTKWRNGIFCIWYPLLSPQRLDRVTHEVVDTPKHGLSEKMVTAFTDIAARLGVGLLDIRFAQQAPSTNIGMYGSGMLIINPPYQIQSTLQGLLQYLQKHLKQGENNLSALSILVPSP